ncbi:MAG TPA: YajQ family cyclic di-GMP-binding protein [Steroidobacteraceae bacterium]|nr:YajQ family cyclic di-GMP-binding protein [Steroidobacteraceae bacterium]
MPSFDVVSELNHHELGNAVDQANRELDSRFDFRGTDAKFTLDNTELTLDAPADFQLRQMLEIVRLKLTKRGIDLVCLEIKDPEVNLARARQTVLLREGIDAETGRKLQRAVKDSKLKVQAAIQGDKLRVTGKSRDELQAVMALLRQQKVDVPLQFNNFRD